MMSIDENIGNNKCKCHQRTPASGSDYEKDRFGRYSSCYYNPTKLQNPKKGLRDLKESYLKLLTIAVKESPTPLTKKFLAKLRRFEI
jgi:hypothetical protein